MSDTIETCGIAGPPTAITLAAPAPWRVARSLLSFRDQIDAAAPGRSTRSDGTIGDAAHASRNSDHNPWVKDGGVGVVTAIDITHDPSGGCDCGVVTEALRVSRDSRIKYVIYGRRLFSSYPSGNTPAWTWRTYSGSNPHTSHMHMSVQPTKSLYDSTAAWSIGIEGGHNDVETTKGIQRCLIANGFTGADGKPITADGIWGPNTEAAFGKMAAAAKASGLTEAQVDLIARNRARTIVRNVFRTSGKLPAWFTAESKK